MQLLIRCLALNLHEELEVFAFVLFWHVLFEVLLSPELKWAPLLSIALTHEIRLDLLSQEVVVSLVPRCGIFYQVAWVARRDRVVFTCRQRIRNLNADVHYVSQHCCSLTLKLDWLSIFRVPYEQIFTTERLCKAHITEGVQRVWRNINAKEIDACNTVVQ